MGANTLSYVPSSGRLHEKGPHTCHAMQLQTMTLLVSNARHMLFLLCVHCTCFPASWKITAVQRCPLLALDPAYKGSRTGNPPVHLGPLVFSGRLDADGQERLRIIFEAYNCNRANVDVVAAEFCDGADDTRMIDRELRAMGLKWGKLTENQVRSARLRRLLLTV
eukprot:361935-Chlamydomonas_euryale.AAC.11